MKRNIYLVGFMGTGKSTVGRELARLMGRQFVDIDKMMERMFNQKVKQLYREFGTEKYREEEKRVTIDLAKTTNKIIAAGADTFLDEDVQNAFYQSGLIICLFTENDYLVERLKRTDHRPQLDNEDGEDLTDKINDLLVKRKKIFDKISIRLDTTNLSPPQAAMKIVDLLRTRQKILDQLQKQFIILR